jgi:phage N-6-adenine-methyltransferase
MALSALSLTVEGRNLPPGQTIGHRIVSLRERRHLSQRKLASLAHSTQPTIIAIEKRNQGRLATLDSILTVLGSGHYLAEPGVRKDFYSNTGNSSTGMNWQTPTRLLEALYEAFGIFDVDPCSPTTNRASAPVKARVHYTAADDGLSLPWHGTVFINPPYGRALRMWVAKAEAEVLCGNASTVVALIPARTDTRYWHEHVAGNATVFFLRGRLTFGAADAAAPFPSMLAIWGAAAHQVAALEQRLPDAWMVPPAMPPTSPLPPSEP